MEMTARYTVIEGEIISQTRGAARRECGPDANGNTVALINDSSTVTDTFTYWPYGEVKTRTGTTPTPFQFGGGAGYYTNDVGTVYVRLRTFHPTIGSWLTVDHAWPSEPPYSYAHNAPTVLIDPSGSDPVPKIDGCGDKKSHFNDAVIAFCRDFRRQDLQSCLENCFTRCRTLPFPSEKIKARLKCMQDWCQKPKIKCVDCRTVRGAAGACAFVYGSPGSNCTIHICKDSFYAAGKCFYEAGKPRLTFPTFIHELGHCCGNAGAGTSKAHQQLDELSVCMTECMGFTWPPGFTFATGFKVPGG